MFNLNTREEISIRKRTRQKYKVTLKGHMNMLGITTQSHVENTWLVSCLDIYDNGNLKMEVLNLDTKLVTCDNDSMLDIFYMTSHFQKCYKEVVMIVDKKGQLEKLINIDTIKERYNQVKTETLSFTDGKQKSTLQEMWNIKDEDIEKQGGIQEMIKQMEFFSLFFNCLYECKHPMAVLKTMKNPLNTNELEWIMSTETFTKTNEQDLGIYLKGEPNLSKKWLKKAYGVFPFLSNVESLTPELIYDATYIINKETGFVKTATIAIKETVISNFFNHMEYTLEAID